jgi:hypothetical protein
MQKINSDFFYRQMELEITEYDSESVRSSAMHAQIKEYDASSPSPYRNIIRFSFFRLAVASAKTILTRAPLDVDLIKEVRAALYMLDSMIDPKVIDFKLTNGFRKKYRDFSKTGRTGELAQAISFIFSQEILGYPIVIDFDGFLESEKIPQIDPDLKTPDFALLFKNGEKKPSLLESKGTCPPKFTNSVKSQLKMALDQCRTGECHIYANAKPTYQIKNSFGTLISASESQDKWKSGLKFCDPEANVIETVNFPMDAARRYYSAWLVLARRPGLARKLFTSKLEIDDINIENNSTTVNNIQYIAFKPSKNKFDVFTPLLSISNDKEKRKLPKNWLIRMDILKSIINNDINAFSKIMEELSQQQVDYNNESGLIQFRDGTMCQI